MKPNKSAKSARKLALTMVNKLPVSLVKDLRQMILQSREQVMSTVNAGLTLLYWSIGGRILRDVLQDKRAGYGEKIVQTVSAQ